MSGEIGDPGLVLGGGGPMFAVARAVDRLARLRACRGDAGRGRQFVGDAGRGGEVHRRVRDGAVNDAELERRRDGRSGFGAHDDTVRRSTPAFDQRHTEASDARRRADSNNGASAVTPSAAAASHSVHAETDRMDVLCLAAQRVAELVELRLIHWVSPRSCSSWASARCRRLFTVPGLMRNAAAVSSTDQSSSRRQTTTDRRPTSRSRSAA